MTTPLYHEDPYLRDTPARVAAITAEGGLVLDRALFYPQGGGQPGDSGVVTWDGRRLPVATTMPGYNGEGPVLVPAEPVALPPLGAHVVARLDWERRHAHMRVHTALHLLSVVIPLPVTGGQIGSSGGRLDFLMPEPPEDREALEEALNALVDRDLEVTQSWISEADLAARPELVKTLTVKPPRGAGRIRLVQIGQGAAQVDLQPCGGTHVARTSEIGGLRLGKIENKGKGSRRVQLLLA
jgi:misacylated tRNA(Ala) deacylase